MSETVMPKSAAIIGSFRQHYSQVLNAWNVFTDAGIVVTSPKGAPTIDGAVEFVRFETDDPELTDPQVQSLALNRIFLADFTYGVFPGRYVGRTAAYEIGRILQASKPFYMSDMPNDLPIEVPASHICSPEQLVERFKDQLPKAVLSGLTGMGAELEQNLISGNYSDL